MRKTIQTQGKTLGKTLSTTPGSEPALVPLAPEEIDAVAGGTICGVAPDLAAAGIGTNVAAAACGPIVLINGQSATGSIDGPIRLPF